MTLSPQMGVHVQSGVHGQLHPGSTPKPLAVHPFPSPGAPSSHTSLPTIVASFRIGVQTVGEAPLQVQPASTVQLALHPFPAAVPPSSHASGVTTNPSPHKTVQVKAPGAVPVHDQPGATPEQPVAHP